MKLQKKTSSGREVGVPEVGVCYLVNLSIKFFF